MRVGGRAGDDVYDRGVPVALGDCNAHLGGTRGRLFFVDLVLGRGQVAGVSVERLKQSVKSASGDVTHAGLGYVIGLDLLKNLGIHAHLLVGAILAASGVDAEQAEFAHG